MMHVQCNDQFMHDHWFYHITFSSWNWVMIVLHYDPVLLNCMENVKNILWLEGNTLRHMCVVLFLHLKWITFLSKSSILFQSHPQTQLCYDCSKIFISSLYLIRLLLSLPIWIGCSISHAFFFQPLGAGGFDSFNSSFIKYRFVRVLRCARITLPFLCVYWSSCR